MLHAVTDHIYNPDTWAGSGGGALLSTEGSISLSALNNERLLLTAGWRMTSSRHTYMSTFPAFPHWSESSYEQWWAVRNGIREKNSSITYPSSRSDVGCNALNNKRSSDKSPASGINQCFNCTLDCKPHTAWGLNCSCHHNTHTHTQSTNTEELFHTGAKTHQCLQSARWETSSFTDRPSPRPSLVICAKGHVSHDHMTSSTKGRLRNIRQSCWTDRQTDCARKACEGLACLYSELAFWLLLVFSNVYFTWRS